jgi:NAD(P)H-dependent FMN reductase
MNRPRLGVIIGSTRPGRFSERMARWIAGVAEASFEVDLLDLRDYPLPFFDEARAPMLAPPVHPVARAWGEKLAACDAFIATVAEYNRGPTAVLKNAIDYAYAEWARKPIGFVGYGGVGAARAVEQLRLIAIEVQMAPIRTGIHLAGADYFAVLQGRSAPEEMPHLGRTANELVAQLRWWTDALKAAREAAN